MSAQYPNAVKTFTTKNAGDVIQPADVNDLQDEVNAIEDGLLNGKAPLNSSNSTVRTLSVTTGVLTLNGVVYQLPSSGGSTGQVLAITSTSGSTFVTNWQSPTAGTPTLLKANSGTDANAAATTVDTVSLVNLTALDTLKVFVNIETSSQNTGQVVLRHETDAVTLVKVSTGTLATAAPTVTGEALFKQRNGNSTNITGIFTGFVATPAAVSDYANTGVTTAWTSTSAWTIGLRHGGVTAGGTFKWTWAVYKFPGQ